MGAPDSSVTLAQQGALYGYAALLGAFASAPFIWCYIFATVYSFEVFVPWQTVVFRCGLPALLLAVAGSCFLNTDHVKPHVETLVCGACVAILFTFTAACFYVPVPVLVCGFLAALVFMILWPRICFDLVYVCPPACRRAFETGFLIALLSYAVPVALGYFNASVFVVPLFLYVSFGPLAIYKFTSSPAFARHRDRCRSIYQKVRRYNVKSLGEMVSRSKGDLIFVFCGTMIFSLILLALQLFAGGLPGRATFLVAIGAMFGGGVLAGDPRVVSALYGLASMALLAGAFISGRDHTVLFHVAAMCFANFVTARARAVADDHPTTVSIPRLLLLMYALCALPLAVMSVLIKIFCP